MNPVTLALLALLLFGQTNGEPFFEKVTPGLSGIFVPLSSSYISHTELSISVGSVLSAYELFPYEKRATSPAVFGEFGIGLFNRFALFLKAGTYPKNETDRRANLFGAGIRYSILKNENREHLSLRFSYNTFSDLRFHPQDPNFTAQYSRLSNFQIITEVNKKFVGLFFGATVGYQFNVIDGSYWQELVGTVTEFDETIGSFLVKFNIEKRLAWFGFGLGASISKSSPAVSACVSFYK